MTRHEWYVLYDDILEVEWDIITGSYNYDKAKVLCDRYNLSLRLFKLLWHLIHET